MQRASVTRSCQPLDVADLIHMHVEPVLQKPVLVLAFAGWNDAGDSATGALGYFDATLHTASLAEVDPDPFFDFTVRRPEVIRRDDGSRRVLWPTTSFRFGSLDARREIVTGVGVEPHLHWRGFTDTLLELVQVLGVESIVLLGAYQADVVYSQPVPITGFASDESVLRRLDVEPSEYQGPTGIVGVLGSRFEGEGLPVVSLWAGLPHYIGVSPNPRGTLALVQKLSAYLDVQVEEEPLRKRAAEFEEQISKLVASDPELSEYVRQLKRRDFAR